MTSRLENLENLCKIGKLKSEPPAQSEFNGLLSSAGNKLRDAENSTLSPESRFSLAYDAAHSLALAALRWHGYRAEDRYIDFQALPHTLSFSAARWRFLDDCHRKRNAALYEGAQAPDELLIAEFIELVKEMDVAVKALGDVPP
ncbi:MAG: hypothetical protein A3H35_14035 [Betaproteobacteria bacterium RIFCSPLOWO2_02_FULL_62_17]|nr:MAG: hypothetical protein A3H35_14035 [Betaproteobacteria bacterium RIFCSPLOWO2_02_FULL_62_17]